MLIEWVTYLSLDRGIRPGSIRQRLAGLRSLHVDLGLPDAAFGQPRLDRVLRGIRRSAGEQTRRVRLPVTLPVLVRVLAALTTLPVSSSDRTLLAAAFALAYVGGLRCGEITYDTGKFDPRFDMARSDFTDCGSYAVVRLPSSKTDPFRRGVDILVPSVSPLCPVDPLRLLRARVAAVKRPTDPLFSRLDISAAVRHRAPALGFSRSFFVDSLRSCLRLAGIDASQYAGHSFRRGLATWAKLSSKMDDGDIKLLGRWSSDAVKLYQETPRSRLLELAASTLVPNPAVPLLPSARQCWWGDEM